MMKSKGVVLLASLVAVLQLSGCSQSPRGGTRMLVAERYEPWRELEERSCLASGRVRESRFVASRSTLGGPETACGALNPFEVAAVGRGQIALSPAALLRCPMIPAVESWVDRTVAPAADRYFGQPVVGLKVAASYACRPMNGIAGARLSEHGRANALDVSAFILADGSEITVKHGWSGGSRESGFLREVHRGACGTFSTVLGPNADRFHHDHFHLDLARHGRDGRLSVCQ